MADRPLAPEIRLASWMTYGIYRVLDIELNDADGDPIKWTSEDKEFKRFFERVRPPSQAPRRSVSTVSQRKPSVKLAILDCGIDAGVYFKDRIADRYGSPTAGASAEKHQRLVRDVSTKEAELNSLRLELSVAEGDPEVRAVKPILAKREKPTLEGEINTIQSQPEPEQDKVALATKQRRLETINRALGLSDLRARVLKCEQELRQLNTDLGYAVPGAHGTMCGGRAAWGTDMIKVYDVRLQYGNATGNNNMAEWLTALKWAVEEQRVDVVSCSVTCKYDQLDRDQTQSIGDFMRAHPETIFVMSAGNDYGTLYAPAELRGAGVWAPAASNVLLVSGVTRNGKLCTLSRWGEIDLYAPACYYHQYKNNTALYGGGTPNNKSAPLGLPNKYGIALEGVENDTRARASGVPDSVMDYGVSFAVPMVANVAAKCKLIDPALDGRDIAKLIKDTAENTQSVTPRTEPPLAPPANQTARVQMLNPIAAYEKAAAVALLRAATTGARTE